MFPARDGTALEERKVRHVFTRMLEKAELRPLRIHDLRQTFATLLLHAGPPITYVSQQLGHADASITLRVYAHYLPNPSRKDVDLLDTQPSATPAQPDQPIAAEETQRARNCSGKVVSGEGIEPSTRRLRVVSSPFSGSRELFREPSRFRCLPAA